VPALSRGHSRGPYSCYLCNWNPPFLIELTYVGRLFNDAVSTTEVL
jgi:hypothetical protein